MPKRNPPKSPTSKTRAAKTPATTAKPEKSATEHAPTEPRPRTTEDRLAVRMAVFEDVIRRASQETRALQAELANVRAAQTDLARRIGDVEKRVAAS